MERFFNTAGPMIPEDHYLYVAYSTRVLESLCRPSLVCRLSTFSLRTDGNGAR